MLLNWKPFKALVINWNAQHVNGITPFHFIGQEIFLRNLFMWLCAWQYSARFSLNSATKTNYACALRFQNTKVEKGMEKSDGLVCDSVTWGHLGWGMKSVRGSVMGFCLELLLWIWIRFGPLCQPPRRPSWCSIIQKVFMDTHPFVHFHFGIDFAHCIVMNFKTRKKISVIFLKKVDTLSGWSLEPYMRRTLLFFMRELWYMNTLCG